MESHCEPSDELNSMGRRVALTRSKLIQEMEESLQSLHDDFAGALSRKEIDSAVLRAKNEELSKEVRGLMAIKRELTEALETHQKQLHEMRERLNERERENAELSKALSALRAEHEPLKRDIIALREHNRALETEREMLTERLMNRHAAEKGAHAYLEAQKGFPLHAEVNKKTPQPIE